MSVGCWRWINGGMGGSGVVGVVIAGALECVADLLFLLGVGFFPFNVAIFPALFCFLLRELRHPMD